MLSSFLVGYPLQELEEDEADVVYSNAGGGGERVLWAAIRATQQRWPKAVCVVYSGDHDVNRSSMVERVQTRFNITLHPPTLVFMYLSTRHLVLASTYPHFTLLGQSLGSLALGYDAFNLLVPDIFIDTMGYAFTLALCHYLFPEVPTAAYTHYPTISTDMLDSLGDAPGGRGVNAGRGKGPRGLVKKQYWHLFARLYGWVGGHIDVVMCNSSWTRAHITSLWKTKKSLSSFATVIYPPCPVEEFEKQITVSEASESQREPLILYIAQFRPEKDHALVLRSFARFIHSINSDTLPTSSSSDTTSQSTPRLVLIGSVRADTPDETHIYNLRLLAHELHIKDQTTFICDAPFSTILQYLQKASIGVNGMWNEHFGIGVVEYQAAGLIPVVHDSGGPKLDIVVPFEGKETGFHASSEEEFANGFRKVLEEMGDKERAEMRLRARKNSKRFTEEVFAKKWVGEMEELIGLQVARTKR